MCIVIDTNTFSSVFNIDSSDHEEFKPVLDWITNGKGKMVMGGTKYMGELKKAPKYLTFFRHLNEKNKIVSIDDHLVDNEQKRLESLSDLSKCNDHHIVAIIAVSGCKLICSKDVAAYKFFKNKDLYPKNVSKPRIYCRVTNKDLLNDNMITACCKSKA